MLDFDEELEKFQPSLEIDQAEEAIYQSNRVDVTDIIRDVVQEMKDKKQ